MAKTGASPAVIQTPVVVAKGGTGAATLTGLVKGNGTSAMTAVTAPSGTVVGTTDSQTLTNKLLSTGSTFDNNLIPAAALATSAITLGYAQITANATTTNTSATAIASATVTVTIPAGSRRILIAGFTGGLYANSATVGAILTIWDGTVGSGTQLSRCLGISNGSAATNGLALASVTPAAGSKTYALGLHAASAATATFEASATAPGFILVMVI